MGFNYPDVRSYAKPSHTNTSLVVHNFDAEKNEQKVAFTIGLFCRVIEL